MTHTAHTHRTALARACIVLALFCATLWPGSSAMAETREPQAPFPSSPTALGSGPDALLQPAEAEEGAGQEAILHLYLPAIRRPETPAEAMLAAINRTRTAHGCAALAANAKLTHAAQGHSQDMADHHLLSHDGTDGSTLGDRVLREGYVYAYIGEAIARWDGVSPAEVLGLWLDSGGHERIILNCMAKDGGVGLVEGYWTVVVGSEL